MNVEAVVDSFEEIPTADSQSCLVCMRFYVRLCLGEWALGKITLERDIVMSEKSVRLCLGEFALGEIFKGIDHV